MAESPTSRTLATIPHESITVDFALRATLHRFWLRLFLWSRTHWHHRTGMVRLWADVSLVAIASVVLSALATRLEAISPNIHSGILGLLVVLVVAYLVKFREFSTLREQADCYVEAKTDSIMRHHEALQRLAHRFLSAKSDQSQYGLQAIARHCATLSSTDAAHPVNITNFIDTICACTKDFPKSEHDAIEAELYEARKTSTETVSLPQAFEHKLTFLHMLTYAAVVGVCVFPLEVGVSFISTVAQALEIFESTSMFEHITTYISGLDGAFLASAKGIIGALIVRRIGGIIDVIAFNEIGKPNFSDTKQRTFRLVSGGMELYRLKDLYSHGMLRPDFTHGALIFAVPKLDGNRKISLAESIKLAATHGKMYFARSRKELIELHRRCW